ncbi:hypothetical protein M0R45_013543 [Rubus argutus]|uniref:Uncharacterized protein n=1 Tax=Rubus argutus TaxID=59490 RepID=A0AAW1XK05_RUBAR
MGEVEAQELQLSMMVQEANEATPYQMFLTSHSCLGARVFTGGLEWRSTHSLSSLARQLQHSWEDSTMTKEAKATGLQHYRCFLYSVGLSYLPVSTYSLICASQLAFNALFSFFFNSQKFTPYIVNSLVILTISSTLLVLQGDDETANSKKFSKGKYLIGFFCTVGASAGYALTLSLTQLVFVKHYLDDRKSKTEKEDANNEVSKAFPLENING